MSVAQVPPNSSSGKMKCFLECACVLEGEQLDLECDMAHKNFNMSKNAQADRWPH